MVLARAEFWDNSDAYNVELLIFYDVVNHVMVPCQTFCERLLEFQLVMSALGHFRCCLETSLSVGTVMTTYRRYMVFCLQNGIIRSCFSLMVNDEIC